MLKKIPVLLVALAIVAAACGDDDEPAAPAATQAPATRPPTPTTQAPAPPATEAPAVPATTAPGPSPAPSSTPTVQVSATGLGDILTDADGNTLYLFTPDQQGPSVCNDACATAWPPLEGEPSAGDGIDAALLATAARDDGTTQATYNGWPLYYYAADAAPGDTNGQAVNDIWWVISPTGEAIMGG
jgi:predicted lipoprotein with Yx(FWY)xxD motif